MNPSPLRSLRSIRLFESLPADVLRKIEAACEWRSYVPDESIVTDQDETCDVFFLVDGTVRVVRYALNGTKITLREDGPGTFFGEFAALDGQKRSASVEALTACLVARMNDRAFVDMLERHPAVMMALLRHVVGVARRLTGRVYEFSALGVNERIQAELLRLARLTCSNGKSATITPAPTHADIATRISTHREAVTREFSRLKKLGLIKPSRHCLEICDVERLKRLVDDATGEA